MSRNIHDLRGYATIHFFNLQPCHYSLTHSLIHSFVLKVLLQETGHFIAQLSDFIGSGLREIATVGSVDN